MEVEGKEAGGCGLYNSITLYYKSKQSNKILFNLILGLYPAVPRTYSCSVLRMLQLKTLLSMWKQILYLLYHYSRPLTKFWSSSLGSLNLRHIMPTLHRGWSCLCNPSCTGYWLYELLERLA